MSRPRRLSFWILLPLVFLVFVIGIVLVRVANDAERRLYALDANSGKVVWSAAVDFDWNSYARPVVAEGQILVPSDDTISRAASRHWQLAAYDSATGARKWTYAPFGDAGAPNLCQSMVAAGPVVADGRVYVWVCAGPQGDGSTTFDKAAVVALDAASGEVLWEHDAPDLSRTMTFGSPLPLSVIGDTAYVLSQNASDTWTLDALDVKTGSSLRQMSLADLDGHDPTDLPAPSLQADNQTLFVNVENIMAIDPASGNVHYQVSVNQVPWLADKALFGRARAVGDDAFASYREDNGVMLWQTAIDQTLIPDAPAGQLSLSMQMSADADNVYVFVVHPVTQHLWLTAIRRGDGSRAWSQDLGIQEQFTDLVFKPSSNGKVVAYYEATADGSSAVRAASAAEGALLWSFQADTDGQSPVVDDQRVYFLDESPRFRQWLAPINPAWH